MRADLTQQILDLEPGAHVCLLYERHAEELLPAIVPFLLEGFARNEHCVYVVADQTAGEFRAHLRARDIDVEKEIERGRLRLWTREEWRQPGELDSAKKSAQITRLVAEARTAGFKGIRFAVEMGWTLDPAIAAGPLEHWEATISTLFPADFPARMICQYHRARLAPEVVLAALNTHPLVILDGELCQNVFSQSPLILQGDGLGETSPEKAAARVHWMISQLRKTRFAERQAQELFQQRRAQQRLALQWATNDILSDATSFHDVAPIFLRQICTDTGWDVGCFWSIDEPRAQLRCTEFWQSPDFPESELEAFTRAQNFRCGAGLPGRVWLDAAPHWIDGFSRNQDLMERSGATRAPLASACAFPVAIRHEVIGVIELFSRHPRERNTEILEMLVAASAPVGNFFERRRAELKQRLTDERLRRLVSLMPAGMYTCDAEGRITFANRRAAELWGREPNLVEDRFSGGHRRFQSDGTPVAPGETPMARALRGGKSCRNLQAIVERPDGTRFISSESIDLIFDDDGQITGAIDVFQDITESKRSENLVNGQNRALQLLISGAPLEEIFASLTNTVEAESAGGAVAGILLLDADGRRLVHGAAPGLPQAYNEAIDGIEIGPDIGTCCAAAYRREVVITPDIASEANWAGLKTLPLGLGLRAAWSMPIFSSHGKVLGTFGTYFRECRVPSEQEKEIVGVLCKTAAIAIERHRSELERKRTEREIEHARDEAVSASRAKDDFLAALSHELRTPLSPVLLLASDAAQNGLVPEPWRADFETIRRNVELEARLIDDLLDLTRITRGKLPVDRRATDANAVLQEAVGAVRADIATKQIVLTVNLDAAEPVVWGDPVRLQQVFWNILKNAVKFTARGGRISIETRVLAERRRFTAKITDSGIGMTATELPRVFDAFSQGEHAGHGGSHVFGGLGLGLAIARRLVELHEGHISATSPGRDGGSEFVIELPLMRKIEVGPAESDAIPEPARAISLKGKGRAEEIQAVRGRILLVEDHAATRTTLENLLRRRRFEVVSAATVAEAFALAGNHGITLVISDIGLPDGNGYDLMTELRDRYGLKGIALSGYGMESDVNRSHVAGFSTHLTKPVCVRTLDEALNAASETAAA
ncbi:MAG TPA: MEDS domain-containing protein [Opitutaceae bacterium]|nr:MEDS domain-containing protein [Opitutaceae bacterium]